MNNLNKSCNYTFPHIPGIQSTNFSSNRLITSLRSLLLENLQSIYLDHLSQDNWLFWWKLGSLWSWICDNRLFQWDTQSFISTQVQQIFYFNATLRVETFSFEVCRNINFLGYNTFNVLKFGMLHWCGGEI